MFAHQWLDLEDPIIIIQIFIGIRKKAILTKVIPARDCVILNS